MPILYFRAHCVMWMLMNVPCFLARTWVVRMVQLASTSKALMSVYAQTHSLAYTAPLEQMTAPLQTVQGCVAMVSVSTKAELAVDTLVFATR